MLQVQGLHFSQKDLHRTNGEGGIGIKFPVVASGVEVVVGGQGKLHREQLIKKGDVLWKRGNYKMTETG